MADQPIDVVLSDPASESTGLYRYARFLDKRPVRVSIPLVPGFRKAVIVAAALQFAVRLTPGQPDPVVIPELLECLNFYLRDRTIRQPVEFFHSFLWACYQRTRITLWDIYGQTPPSHRLQPECASCEYLLHCNGFFKSPCADYVCTGVKQVLAKLTEAAAKLDERHCDGVLREL